MSPNSLLTACGNGIVTPATGEECDDGFLLSLVLIMILSRSGRGSLCDRGSDEAESKRDTLPGVMPMNVDKYTYRVTWSEEDREYVGLCAEFPSLSWLAKSQTAALKGIRKAVSDSVRDMKKNKEPCPEPIATKRCSGKFVIRVPPGPIIPRRP